MFLLFQCTQLPMRWQTIFSSKPKIIRVAEIEPSILCAQSIVCSKETAVLVSRRTGGILLFLLSVKAKTIQLFVAPVRFDVA